MSAFKKIAVTIPAETYKAVERARRRLGKARSAIVATALDEWLRGQQADEAARRYVEGYLRQPETPEEIAVTEAIAAQAVADWPPWDADQPTRAAESRTPAVRSARSNASRAAEPRLRSTRAKR